MVNFPSASPSFLEQTRTDRHSYGILREKGDEAGVATLALAEVISEDQSQLFADQCCHYNEKGTTVIAGHIADFVVNNLPARPVESTPPER